MLGVANSNQPGKDDTLNNQQADKTKNQRSFCSSKHTSHPSTPPPPSHLHGDTSGR
jgi:hypothetical protein